MFELFFAIVKICFSVIENFGEDENLLATENDNSYLFDHFKPV